MKEEAVAYAREAASTAAPKVARDYPLKFANLVRLARTRRTEIAVVAFPGVLGDTYDEVMQSLSLLAEQGLRLMIAKPQPGAVPLNALRRQRRRRRNRR
jgi:hypothetical protein